MTPSQFRTWRKHAGLSQSEAARMLGKSDKSIQRYENGKSSIPADVAAAMLTVKSAFLVEDGDAFITPATHPHLYRKDRRGYYPNRENPGFIKTGEARFKVKVSELATYVPPPPELNPMSDAELDALYDPED